MSDWGTQTVTPTRSSQWERSCLGGKTKNDKNGNNFHNRRKHFSLFVISVDGMLINEALVVLVNLS